MKLLIDATNLKLGGAIQVCMSVIEQFTKINDPNVDIFYLISDSVFAQASGMLEGQKFEVLSLDVKNLLPWDMKKKRVRKLAKENDFVFTIFGPTFWGYKENYHLVGFANAWIVTPDTIAYSKFRYSTRMLMKIKFHILGRLLWNKNIKYVTETDSVKENFLNKYKCKHDIISVVPNALNYIYEKINIDHIDDRYKLINIKKFKFITISHNYPHKNLSIIEDVFSILRLKNIDCVFVVTLSDHDYERQTDGFKEATINVGPVDIQYCPNIYKYCDALFLPTLIECFTVSYLEAMYMKLPICTSEFDFAKTVCSDAAQYFNPLSVIDIAEKLEIIINDRCVRDDLVKNGERRLSYFPNHTSRAEEYMKIIKGELNV